MLSETSYNLLFNMRDIVFSYVNDPTPSNHDEKRKLSVDEIS